jgi:hypothetical protein
MSASTTGPRVRWLGSTPVSDNQWHQMMGDIRAWREQGAPYRAIADMLADDYGIELDDDTVRRLLNITDSVESPRD